MTPLLSRILHIIRDILIINKGENEMNELTVFNNEEFGEVRTITIDGEPWFVANDILRVLAVSNLKDALRTLDDDEKSGVDIIDPHGRKQKTNCISEAGLYSIILRSRKPEAKAFKRWVTHDILPTKPKPYRHPVTGEMCVPEPSDVIKFVPGVAFFPSTEPDYADL